MARLRERASKTSRRVRRPETASYKAFNANPGTVLIDDDIVGVQSQSLQ